MRALTSIALAFALAAPPAAAISPSRHVIAEIRRADSLERVSEQTSAGLEALLMGACFQLRLHGYGEDCQAIKDAWQGGMKRRYQWATIDTEGLGDHRPLSLWLAIVYGILESRLGPNIMKMLHLDDINIFNFAVPVVRDPHESAAWCLEMPNTPCKVEYGEHFVPLAGVASYWISWALCTGATWGMGAVSFLCSPIADLTERIVCATVAPRLSNRIWDRSNPVFEGIDADAEPSTFDYFP
jgi:hypothetical protein